MGNEEKEKEKVEEFAGEGIVMQIKRSSGWRKKNLHICQLNIGLSRCRKTMSIKFPQKNVAKKSVKIFC